MSGRRLLAIFAHPDDECLLAGGTLAACAAAGMEVHVLSLTAGEAGPIEDPTLATTERLGEVRAAELRAAAGMLGATAECLSLPDGELSSLKAGAIEALLVQRLREQNPDVVITFGPEGWYWHPDHVAVHERTLAALDRLAGEGLHPSLYFATWPEGYMAALVAAVRARGIVPELWGLHPDAFGAPPETITTTLDVRPFLAAKVRALRCHRTQIGSRHLLASLPDDLAEAYLGREFFIFARSAQGTDTLLTDSVPALTIHA